MYKYQMHAHTAPCSECSQMSPEKLILALKRGGYTGVVITNHFYKGYTGIDRSLSWHDFVSAYEKDYIELKSLAKNHDIDVIFGIEEHIVDGLEILCYGITPQVLYDNPSLKNASLKDWSRIIRDNGGLIIQAHPFRSRYGINNPRVLDLSLIDGIEVYNYGNPKVDDIKALEFSKENPHLILTSGADTHNENTSTALGIKVFSRIRDEKSLASVLKSHDYTLIPPPDISKF